MDTRNDKNVSTDIVRWK